MKSGKKIVLLITVFLLWVLLFILQKPVFLLAYGGISHLVAVVWHGIPLDLSMAGYLTVFPALLVLLCSLSINRFHRRSVLKVSTLLLKVYFVVAAACYSLAFVSNLFLYDYWRFPLDYTPIFFIT